MAHGVLHVAYHSGHVAYLQTKKEDTNYDAWVCSSEWYATCSTPCVIICTRRSDKVEKTSIFNLLEAGPISKSLPVWHVFESAYF